MTEINVLRNILIVDDEEEVRFIISKCLTKIVGVGQVETACNGEEALDKIKHNHYDLLVTDLKMPKMDGISLTEAAGEISPETHVIWITAFTHPELLTKAESLGVQYFLSKPLDITDIRKIAQEALTETIKRQTDLKLDLSSPFDSLRLKIRTLREDIDAYAVMIITKTGHLIDADGLTQEMDATSLSALIAANFIAANEIATMLGRNNTFKVSFYESDQYNIYAYGLGEDYLLVTVFGSDIKTGTVWFYTKKAAVEFETLLHEMDMVHSLPKLISREFSKEVEHGLGQILDDLWETPAASSVEKNQLPEIHERASQTSRLSSQQILTYEQAVEQHILSNDRVI